MNISHAISIYLSYPMISFWWWLVTIPCFSCICCSNILQYLFFRAVDIFLKPMFRIWRKHLWITLFDIHHSSNNVPIILLISFSLILNILLCKVHVFWILENSKKFIQLRNITLTSNFGLSTMNSFHYFYLET